MLLHERLGEGSGPSGGEALHQLHDDPDARQLLERVGAVLSLGIQDGDRVGELAQGLVVIGHDDLDPMPRRELHLVGRGDPAIRGDHELGAALPGDLHPPLGEAVPISDPIGNEIGDLGAEGGKGRGEEGRGGDPVDVVVAKDEDLLPLVDCLPDPGGGQIHVPHHKCVQ